MICMEFFEPRNLDLEVVREWHEGWLRLINDKIPAEIGLRQWGADFNHGQKWLMAPLVFNPEWKFLKTNKPQAELRIISEILSRAYPRTSEYFSELISNDKLSYVAYSVLLPGAVLKTHNHFNPNSRKFHHLIYCQGDCGLMYMMPLSDGKLQKQIHSWKEPGECLVFNDNWPHSAWNNSEEPRIVLVIDYSIPSETNEEISSS